MSPPPPPYWTYDENRLLTMTESTAYEEAVVRQQQARRRSDPPSYHTVHQNENQVPINRSANPPANNSTNSVDGNALRGYGRARSVDVTSPSQVAQPGHGQYAHDQFAQHYQDETAQEAEARFYQHGREQLARVQASQDRYFAVLRAQAQNPTYQRLQDEETLARRQTRCTQFIRESDVSMEDAESQVQQQSGEETDISGHLERMQLNGKTHERR